MTVQLGDIVGAPGDTVWLPVSLSAVDDTVEAFVIIIRWDSTYLEPLPAYPGDVFLEFETAGEFTSVANDFFVQLSQNSADSGAIVAFFNVGGPGPFPVLPPGDHGVIFRIPFGVDPGTPPGTVADFGFSAVNEFVVVNESLMEAYCADCRRSNMAVKYDCVVEVYDTISVEPLVLDTLLDTVSCSSTEYPVTEWGSLTISVNPDLNVAWDSPTDDYTGDHCDTVVISCAVTDQSQPGEDDPPASFTVLSGPGAIVSTGDWTANYTYVPTLGDVGAPVAVTLGATDAVHPGLYVQNSFSMTFTNQAPVFTQGAGAYVEVGAAGGCAAFAVDDVDCDTSWVSIVAIVPSPVGDMSIQGDRVCFTPVSGPYPVGDEGQPFTVTLQASDGKSSTYCEITFATICCETLEVQIEKTHNSLQGTHQLVDVVLNQGADDLGGWDFLISYDASALDFQSATPGDFHDLCQWEYFTYRCGPFGNCGSQCPSGLVRVVAIAEANNGPYHPLCLHLPPPAVLFSLDFLVSDDRTLECMYVPVRFYWMDCGDNSIAYHPSDDPLSSVQGVSRYVLDIELNHIENMFTGFPTFTGVQWECLQNDPGKPVPIQFVDFINGGIDIICADSIDARGDINLNGTANEIADAVLFSNYFIHGLAVFNSNMAGQIAATDVNADGLTLSVADLVYLIRVIVGDAIPYAKLAPVEARYTFENGVLSVDSRMGAALAIFDGDVTPQLLAEQMEMKYRFDGQSTRALVSKIAANASFEGAFLKADGELVDLELATYDGAPVVSKPLPGEYRLYQNYPNPFNPKTTIAFVLPEGGAYRVTVYNVTGRRVRSFEGTARAGTIETVEFDGGDLGSGVYFYRLDTDDFSQSRKMVLLK